MKICVVCGHERTDEEMYSDTWCHECVLATLDDQRREDTHKVKKQEFSI